MGDKLSIYLILIIILLLQGTIENIIPYFGYMDELILLVFLVIAFLKYSMKQIEIKFFKVEKYIFILIVLFFFVGIISNFSSEIVHSANIFFTSGLLGVKSFIVYFLARTIFRDIKIEKGQLIKFSKLLNKIINIYVLIILIDIPLNFLESHGMRMKMIKSISAGFAHPAQLDFLAIAIIVIQLFIFRVLNLNMKRYNKILIKGFIIVLFSGRTKAMVFYTGYIILLLLSRFIKNVKLSNLIPFIPVFIIIAKDRVISEFLNSNSVRGILYKTGLRIANDYWPLGSGFATYGSEYSRRYYSQLYYDHGLYRIYGLSPIWPAYITDSQWASILGETGFLGTLVYMIICILFTYFLFKVYKGDIKIKISLAALWIYGFVSSISDTILIEYRGSAIFIITALLISILNSKNSEFNIEKNN